MKSTPSKSTLSCPPAAMMFTALVSIWAGPASGASAMPISLMGPQPAVLASNQTPDLRPILEQPSQEPEPASLEPIEAEVPPSETSSQPPVNNNKVAGLLMAGGIIIITFILMARLRKNKKHAVPQADSPAQQLADIRARASNQTSVNSYKADAHEFTRRMAAILDNKAERLEQLIADADDRIAALELTENSPSAYAPPPAARPGRPPTPINAQPALDPLHDKIYRLADSGLDPISIARETGQQTGQVELILALRA